MSEVPKPKIGPAAPASNEIESVKMTVTQFQNQQDFFFAQVERFKKMFEDSTLAKFIIMAGVSGVVIAAIEAFRALIDMVGYFKK